MSIEQLVPKIIRAGFEKDYNSLEKFALLLSRKLKKGFPEISDEIADILVYRNLGNSSYRSIGMQAVPVDEETRFSLAKVEEPINSIHAPILKQDTICRLNRFILERTKAKDLLKHGVKPSNSIIIHGEPGVGKTYSAKWLASKLDMTLITLDLASTVSSYLGKTGQNLKNILDYAKSFNSILFLDEFDAIAKRRDDETDIGELKRIVNVLLKELESWPVDCIIIAATNHPELLDKAIWRRFDIKLKIDLPDYHERFEILQRELIGFDSNIANAIELFSELTAGMSPSDLCQLCESSKRRYILERDDFNFIFFSELKDYNHDIDDKDRAKICQQFKEYIPDISVNKISEITDIPSSSIYRYLRENS